MDLYAFDYNDDTILVPAGTEEMARCRAFHEVVDSYDVGADRLQQHNWPTDGDYSPLGEIDEPVILEGG